MLLYLVTPIIIKHHILKHHIPELRRWVRLFPHQPGFCEELTQCQYHLRVMRPFTFDSHRPGILALGPEAANESQLGGGLYMGG